MHARPRELSLVAAATVCGWCLHDMALVATTPEPLLVYKVAPACVVAVGLGALAGLLWGVHRAILGLTLLVAAAACALPLVRTSPLPLAWIWLPRAVFLLTLSASAAAWLAPRLRLPAAGTGLAIGAAAALFAAMCTGKPTGMSWLIVTAAAFGLASARVPFPRVRRLAIAAIAGIAAIAVLLRAHERSQLTRPDAPLSAVAAERGRPNVLMIVLDTVRADHLAPYGYERVTTPGLDAFARRCATRYTDAYASSSWTLPSHASLFTGLYPSQHGANYCGAKKECGAAGAQPLRRDAPTLAERFAAHGYQTAAITANAHYVTQSFGLDRGFAHFDDRWGANLNCLLLPQLAGFLSHVGHSIYRRADSITDLALAWIANRDVDRPFFLFVNYMDAHTPHLPAPPYDAAFGGQQPLDPYAPPDSLSALLYDRELLFLDAHLSRLLGALEAHGLLDDTVITITSDHGEAFGEHGLWWHGRSLYDDALRVPLYVKGVGPCRSATAARRTTGIEVYHLVLARAGLEEDSDATEPAKVLAELAGVKNPAVEPDRDLLAWMDGHTKWIASSRGDVEAYDLDGDPHELHNLAVDSDQVARGQAYATRWWSAHPVIITARAQMRPLDDETRERMRNLGY
jgi:arylsulfatase A-like enzyme